MSDMIVSFRDFSVDNLVTSDDPEKTTTKFVAGKDAPAEIQDMDADEIKIVYRYKSTTKDGKTVEVKGPLVVEGPLLTAKRGVEFRTAPGKTIARPFLSVVFDMTDSDQAYFVGRPSSLFRPSEPSEEPEGFIGSFYSWCAEQAYNYWRYQLGEEDITHATIAKKTYLPEKLLLYRQLYKKEDAPDPKMIGKEVPNGRLGNFYKIQNVGIPGTPKYFEGKFISPSGKTVPLLLLQNKHLKVKPQFLFRRIWFGGTKGITCEIKSAVIMFCEPITGMDARLEAMRKRALEENPDIGSVVDDMIEKSLSVESSKPETFGDAKTLAIAAASAAEAGADGDPEDDIFADPDAPPTIEKKTPFARFQGLGKK